MEKVLSHRTKYTLTSNASTLLTMLSMTCAALVAVSHWTTVLGQPRHTKLGPKAPDWPFASQNMSQRFVKVQKLHARKTA